MKASVPRGEGRPRVAVSLVDQDPATTRSIGILNASLGIVGGLAELAGRGEIELVVLAPEVLRGRLPGDGPGIETRWWPHPPRRFARVGWDLWGVAGELRRTGASIALLPKGFLPLSNAGATLLLPLVHDRMFAAYAARGWSHGGLRQRYFSALQDRTLRTAPRVLTTSAAVAAELAPLCRGPVTAIGLGPTGALPPAAAPLLDPVPPDAPLLVPLSPFRHKRTADVLRWIAAWADADPARASRPVLGVGGLPPGFTWPSRPGWTREPRLDPGDWAGRLATCGALVYASDYEGYGLPPREALEAGVRAIASDLPAHREHLPAAILFRNDDPADFATVLDRALASPPPPLPFPTPSWTTVAGRLLEATGLAR